MYKLAAALAVVTLMASPSFAQSYTPEVGSGNIAPAPYASSAGGFSSYAQSHEIVRVPRAHVRHQRSHRNEMGN